MTPRVWIARWVLPIAAPAIPHGAVAVEDGRITYVGEAAGAPDGTRADLGDAVLLPGLVNAHAHLELTAMRGFLEDLPFRQWILRLTRSRAAVMTPARRLAAARVGIGEGLLAGITTYGDVSDCGTSLDALLAMGVRGVMYQEVFGPHPAQCVASVAALRAAVDAALPRATDLVAVGVSPHAPYTVSDALFRATAALARERDLPLTVHVAEGEAEFALVTSGTGVFADAWRARGIEVDRRGRSPVALLHDTGVLGARTLLVHCVRTDDDDLDAIVASGSRVVHCPASNAKLGHGIAPVAEMRARGIPVGLGSDSVASSNRMDLLDEGRLAALQQRLLRREPDVLPAREVLELATLGGARALGLDARVGTLEVGKDADLVAFALDPERDAPSYAPEEALVFGAAGRRPRLVTVRGRTLVRDGALEADLRADRALVDDAARALAAFGDDAR